MSIARKLPTVDMSKAEFIWNKASVDKSILYFQDAHIFKPKKVQITNNRRPEIPVWERSSLTIDQAAVYCGVGKDKLRELTDREDCPFVLWVGSKRLIRRKKLDEYLDKAFSI